MVDRRRILTGLGAAAGLLAAPRVALARYNYRGRLLRDGTVVSLRCLGHIRTQYIFLDGHTTDGTVALAPGRGGNYSGAFWRVSRIDEDVVALECQGHIDGPRWLDGRTRDGTVGLAPHTGGGYTGTRWRLLSLQRDDDVAFECLGSIPGNRWLDGRTTEGAVGLAPHAGPPYTGAGWRVEPA